MRVAKQLTIRISNQELLDWIRVGMSDYDIEEIMTNDCYGFDKDGDLLVDVKLK